MNQEITGEVIDDLITSLSLDQINAALEIAIRAEDIEFPVHFLGRYWGRSELFLRLRAARVQFNR